MATAFTPVDIEARKGTEFSSGDTVRVWSKIEDKGKYRLQAFEGLVLARKHGMSPTATFTVRKVSNGVGIERIFPLYSPLIDKIEVTKKAKTRRAKLYYIRDKAAKEIRRKMKAITQGKDTTPIDPTEISVEESVGEGETVTQAQ